MDAEKNVLQKILDNANEFVKQINFKEVFLFIISLAIITLLIVLFHYSSVQRYVNNNSRCVRERLQGKTKGSYMVYAMNEKNEPMYKVTYTPSAKQFNVDCACEQGNVTNRFDNIKVYDLRNPENPIRKIQNQYCYCNKLIEPTPPENVYYTGYPDLLRFMYNGDTSFFTSV